MKKYILISDFSLTSNNRGTAALGYGTLSFMAERGYLREGQAIVNLHVHLNPFYKNARYHQIIQGLNIEFYDLHVSLIEYKLLLRYGLKFPCSDLSKLINNLSLVAAINGGDGLSDIYGDYLYKARLPYSYIAMKTRTPLVVLPQTIGPFKDSKNYAEAERILKYVSQVFVRDNKFADDLQKMNVAYELTKDLSAYMKPEPWDIDIKPNSIGLNVSGLAYSNKFLDTAGQFDAYPKLIESLINKFRETGNTIYLIPHAYNATIPELNNDDMVACRAAYNRLEDKNNVVFVDNDLISPRVKYVISKMSFICGTRLHANFAAIYTGVPVFGLAYSYKFAGAFEANGLSKDQTLMINNMSEEQIDDAVNKVFEFYCKSINGRKHVQG